MSKMHYSLSEHIISGRTIWKSKVSETKTIFKVRALFRLSRDILSIVKINGLQRE